MGTTARLALPLIVASLTNACGARSELDGAGPPDATAVDVATDVASLDVADVMDVVGDSHDSGPVLVVLASGSPWAIAIDAANVYWTDVSSGSGSVMRCAINGCSQKPTAIATNQRLNLTMSHALAVNTTSVYWLDFEVNGHDPVGEVRRSAKVGPSNPTLVAFVGEGLLASNGLFALAANDANVFWTNGGALASGFGNVLSCPADGCSGPPTTINEHTGYGDIAVDSTDLYWVSFTTIMKCPLAGCAAATPFAMVPFLPMSLAVGNGSVSWSQLGAINDCSTTGCTQPTQLSTYESVVATDGAHVYWAKPGALMRCPIGGCGSAPETLATFTGSVRGIAVDSTSVYWTTNASNEGTGSGQVMKLTPK